MSIIGLEKVPGGGKYTVECQSVECQNREPPFTFSFIVPEPVGTFNPDCPKCGEPYDLAQREGG